MVVVGPSPSGGSGLFADRDYCSGDVIRAVHYVREITEAEPLRPDKGEKLEHCSYPDGRVLLVGEPDCFMNHSCDPNCAYVYTDEATLTCAIRDIKIGEELRVDYLINNEGGDSWPCQCGAARCRGMTGKSFFHLPEDIQREYLPLLASWFCRRHGDELKRLNSSDAGE